MTKPASQLQNLPGWTATMATRTIPATAAAVPKTEWISEPARLEEQQPTILSRRLERQKKPEAAVPWTVRKQETVLGMLLRFPGELL